MPTDGVIQVRASSRPLDCMAAGPYRPDLRQAILQVQRQVFEPMVSMRLVT